MPNEIDPQKRLVVEVKGSGSDVDKINERIAGIIGDIAASGDVSIEVTEKPVSQPEPAAYSQRSSIDLEQVPGKPSWTNQTKAIFSKRLVREKYPSSVFIKIPPELYTWAEEPESGKPVAVISSSNMINFSAEKMSVDPIEAVNKRHHRFFVRMVNYHRREAASHENYVLFDESKAGRRHLPVLGIKVNGSLELLRKLKTGAIGGYRKTDQPDGIRGIGPMSISSFEEYCEELFPGVDVSLATQELDLDLLSRILDKSKRRAATVWAWAVRQEVGSTFLESSPVHHRNNPPDSARPFFINLQALGLIDRRPQNHSSIRPAFTYPYEKQRDSRWTDLENLLIERGDMPEPA